MIKWIVLMIPIGLIGIYLVAFSIYAIFLVPYWYKKSLKKQAEEEKQNIPVGFY